MGTWSHGDMMAAMEMGVRWRWSDTETGKMGRQLILTEPVCPRLMFATILQGKCFYKLHILQTGKQKHVG